MTTASDNDSDNDNVVMTGNTSAAAVSAVLKAASSSVALSGRVN